MFSLVCFLFFFISCNSKKYGGLNRNVFECLAHKEWYFRRHGHVGEHLNLWSQALMSHIFAVHLLIHGLLATRSCGQRGRTHKQGYVWPVNMTETAFQDTASVFQLNAIPE